MLLFFDTEFTGLHKDTTLISLGIVAENGKQFYARSTDYDPSQVDGWIENNVLKNLPIDEAENFGLDHVTSVVGSMKKIREVLMMWLDQFEEVQFVSDVCHYDFVLLIDIFGYAFDLPLSVSPSCHDINQDIARFYQISDKEAFDVDREKVVSDLVGFPVTGKKHNALYDAMMIATIYNAITSQDFN